jgi:hypothetical protein
MSVIQAPALSVFQPSVAPAATSARNLSATSMTTKLSTNNTARTHAIRPNKSPLASAGDAPINVAARATPRWLQYGSASLATTALPTHRRIFAAEALFAPAEGGPTHTHLRLQPQATRFESALRR